MVKEEKKQQVEKLRQLIEQYPVIGIIDMHKLQSKQLQIIKKKMRGKAVITLTKKSILTHAIHAAKKEKILELEKILPQQPGIAFTELGGFNFYGTINKMKSSTFAKAGDIAISDIVVSEGPTDLLPGPAITELTRVGIPAGVVDGKIAVKKEKVVVKKGDAISAELSVALRKLKIEPMEVGINIVAIFENGMIYTKDSLSLVGEGYVNKLKQAYTEALNLSVAVGYLTKQNIKLLLVKAIRSARAIEGKIKPIEVVGESVTKTETTETKTSEENKTEENQNENGGAK